MDRSAWLGLGLGMVIGGVYAWLHVRSLRRRQSLLQQQPRSPMGGLAEAAGRLTFLAVALFLVLQFTGANKFWLAGAVAVAYGVPFLLQFRRMVSRRK